MSWTDTSSEVKTITDFEFPNHDLKELTWPSSTTASLAEGQSDSLALKAEKHVYLTGFKLLAAMISITLVGFLMLLDVSIISTVRFFMMKILIGVVYADEEG